MKTYSNVYIPYNGYYSTPFCPLAGKHAERELH